MICPWTHLSSSSLPKPAHALITWKKGICQEAFLLVAFVGKAALPSEVAHPSHIL
jgi:hypothetical protein